jgi:hypothetical protein
VPLWLCRSSVPLPADAPALHGVNVEGEKDEPSDGHQQDGAWKRVQVCGCGGGHRAMVTCWRCGNMGLPRLVTPQSGIRSKRQLGWSQLSGVVDTPQTQGAMVWPRQPPYKQLRRFLSFVARASWRGGARRGSGGSGTTDAILARDMR